MLTKFKSVITIVVFAIGFCATVQAKPVLNIKHWTTPSGAKVYFVASPEVPIIDINIAFAAGSSRDGNNPGIAALVSDMLNQGAADLGANGIAESFDDVGAIYDADVARDSALVSLRSLTEKDKLNAAIKTFTKIISEPSFPQVALDRERSSHIAAIKQQQQSPDSIASNAFYKALYPNSPYGHPVLGTQESVSRLTRKQAQQFFRQYYVAKNATIAIVGAISQKQAKVIAEQISQEMRPGQAAPKLTKVEMNNTPVTENIKFPSSQTVIRIGQVGIDYHTPDYFPLIVGNYTLGGGTLVSRLFNEVRQKRGLSYSVYSAFVPMAARGPFFIGLGTKNSQAQQAMQVTKQTLQRYVQQGPSNAELEAAKKNITGGFVLRFDSNQKIAGALLTIGVYDLPITFYDDYLKKVNAVTPEQIKQAFARRLFPNKMVTISVGPTVKTAKNG